MRTTVTLRDDLYHMLLAMSKSRRNLSAEINKVLSEHMITEKKIKMLGAFPELDEFSREESDLDRVD